MIYSTYSNRKYSWAKIVALLFILVVTACDETEEVNTLLTVTRIQPAAALPGETVSIFGKGFSSTPADNLVLFDGVKATVQEVTADTVLQVLVPERATSGAIEVKVGNQNAFSPLFLLGTTAKVPVLLELSVSSIEVGQTLSIRGLNFSSSADENIVRIGGVRARLINATESLLTVAVPGLPTGENKQVTVVVSGNISNSLDLIITGFPGKLYWGVTYKYTGPFDGTPFIISANADGSSNALQRKAIPLSTDLALKDGIPYALSFAINAGVQQMVYTKFRFDKFGNPFFDVGTVSTTLWNDFKSLYSSDAPDEIPFAYPEALISSATDDRFFMIATADNTKKVFVGSTAGGPLSVLANSPDLSFSSAYTSSEAFIYTNSITEPVLQKFSTTGTGVPESIPAPKDAIVTALVFSASDHSLYSFIDEEAVSADFIRKVGVYKLVENTSDHQKVAEFEVYGEISNITLLTTDSGLKIFWRAALTSDNPVTTLWMLNLSGAAPHYPVVLYQNPLVMQGSYNAMSAETMAFMQAVAN